MKYLGVQIKQKDWNISTYIFMGKQFTKLSIVIKNKNQDVARQFPGKAIGFWKSKWTEFK